MYVIKYRTNNPSKIKDIKYEYFVSYDVNNNVFVSTTDINKAKQYSCKDNTILDDLYIVCDYKKLPTSIERVSENKKELNNKEFSSNYFAKLVFYGSIIMFVYLVICAVLSVVEMLYFSIPFIVWIVCNYIDYDKAYKKEQEEKE